MPPQAETQRPEIYISTDVESDGPIPGPNSMLSFGSAAFSADRKLLGTFTANLELLPGAVQDPRTMAWWDEHKPAYESTRLFCQMPQLAMPKYADWLESLPGDPVFVAYPAAFDFMFVYWYLIRFAGRCPFSFSALDIKSFAMAVMKSDFKDTTKSRMPKNWFVTKKQTHIALDDAIEQGELFLNILEYSRTVSGNPPRNGPQ